MIVVKRDGRKVAFNPQNIYNAIIKAFTQLGKAKDGEEIAAKISREIENSGVQTLSVEEIQNIVEKKLMASSHKDVAKVYINYRQLRTMARSQYQELMDAVAQKLEAKNVVNQNANVDEKSFGGRVGEASSVVTKQYALEYLASKMARDNHENNEIYIHDLDSYAVGSHNCLSIPFDDLLANGFNTRQTDVRPAQSVNTAFQLIAVIFQLQSLQQFGGVSATHLDWTMVPYVRKSFYKHYVDGMRFCSFNTMVPESHFFDSFKENCNNDMSIEDEFYKAVPTVYNYAMEMTERETRQAVEGLYHNLNTLQSRSGNQLN